MVSAGELAIKISLVGDSGVGKSCLMHRYTQAGNKPLDNVYTSTIGVDFETKRMVIDGETVHVQIWDTAGQERFRTLTTSYYRSSNAILLVFDVTEISTFQSLEIWYNDIHTYANHDVDVMLVGSKADMEFERQVPYETARAWAEEHNMAYIETSSKTGFNVERAFDVLIRACVANYLSQLKSQPNNSVKLTPPQEHKKSSGGCC